MSIRRPPPRSACCRRASSRERCRRSRRGGRARRRRTRRRAVRRRPRRRAGVGAGGEDGGDHGDVGEVGAAVVGVVERVDVARLDAALVAVDDHLYRLAHRAQVDRDVRRVRDQAAVGVEDRAGEVEPLLDVDRVRGRPQPLAHLLGDRHEQVAEDLKEHRVRLRRRPGRGRGSGPTRVSSRSRPPVIEARQPGSTTVVARSSAMMAGPSTACPGGSSRRGRAAPSTLPCREHGHVLDRAGVAQLDVPPGRVGGTDRWRRRVGPSGRGGPGRGGSSRGRRDRCPTETASMMMGLPGIRKENRLR